MTAVNFYRDLGLLKLPLTEVLANASHFVDVPASWHVVISDIKNSTAAVNAGKSNDVNIVAAGSLIAALNIAKEQDIEIPFFFGGDGGTLLVPGNLLESILAALQLHNENSQRTTGLQMHIGSISVSEIVSEGYSLQIAKTQVARNFYKPVVIGDGLRYAERKIKQEQIKPFEGLRSFTDLNLAGLECRWDKVKPPVDENEIVCYLVEATNKLNQTEIYHQVLLAIDNIYGDLGSRHPLSPEKLKLLLDFQKIKREMLLKFGKWKIMYFLTAYLTTLFGKYYFKLFYKTSRYINQLISFSDTITIDGRINTIISGKREKRLQLTDYLVAEEEKGNLVFGYHISSECIMTCYIEDRQSKHIHFVDGADGGYTEAAKKLKEKMATRNF